MEEDDESDEGERDESADEDDGSWEDASGDSGGEDDGEVGELEEEAVDVVVAGAGGVGVAVPQIVMDHYLHEPLPRDEGGLGNVGDAPQDVDPQRLLNNDWCLCGGHCHVEPSFTAEDCICCREIPEVSSEADDLGSQCLTTIDAFEAAILNPITLYIGWMEYTERWRQASKAFGAQNNEKYRYVAYRKVVRWCWGFLGRDIRVQLPACIHSKIMRAYPDGAGNYKGTVLRVLRR